MGTNNKTLNVPNLRFPEFKDEWLNYKLNTLVDRVQTKNKNGDCNRVLTISAQFGLVDQVEFFNRNVSSSNLTGYYLLNNGQFAYNKSYSKGYPWGAVKRLDKYNEGVLSSLYICFNPKESSINSDYLTHYFESTKWHHQVSEIAVEGARNHGLLNIGVSDFFSTSHNVPSLKEQSKIAKFLNLIEQKIKTQMKIIEEYKKLKNIITNKLLERNENLNNFSTLSTFATIIGGYAFNSKSYDESGKYKVITISNVTGKRYINILKTNNINNLPLNIKDDQILKQNDILVSLTGNVGRVSLVNEKNCLLNQRVALVKVHNEQLKEFIFQTLSSKRFQKSMIDIGQGAAQSNISNSDILDYKFKSSENLTELINISRILYFYDQLIISLSRLADYEMKLKEYLTYNLFI